jgi:DNA primase large subunit
MQTQHHRVEFTESDLAKYPFLPQTAHYIQNLNLDITELTSPEYTPILERAEERIKNAILHGNTGKPTRKEIEIPSFPIAMLIIATIGDQYLKKRYALAEAKTIHTYLKEENEQKILQIAKHFKWKIELLSSNGKISNQFTLHFTDYLKNASNFHESEWKLVNIPLQKGEVRLSKNRICRLLQEEIRRYIENKLQQPDIKLPPEISERIEKLKQSLIKHKTKLKLEELPKETIIEAFPPCIKKLYQDALSGKHLSHIGRFALTSFLLNTGMTTENVINLFRQATDFNEKMTRYQVEHIAGTKGSRTRYIPPKCQTLQTHRVCYIQDEICKKIRHPLAYYRRKIRQKR